MSDYSDIIFLMGAIIMFSFLTMSVNRTILMNEMNRVGHQTDYYALSVAQETIDEIRWIRSESALNQKLNEFPKVIEYRADSDQAGSIPFTVDLFETTASIENDDIRSIELRIDVSSDFGIGGEGGNPVQLLFTKSFVK
ncbi:hypothetical protein DYD21_16690 [Rhodohalobacter sp. SW132]|uniref:hypothetical protein n=1 Tax=Rhodohalobacter sp. SW132 TaxID=2293433 RepID=UPI000E236473|nr:hypothetical protein [Rhodohalobacter sp. SW132]REL24798.1 hypothetical protein DYD21_16690 [Rhodohalobacter sp. SW132]